METAVVVAIIAAAASVLGVAYQRWRESRDRITWDSRERKIPVYADCLSAIGEMATRQDDPDSDPTASYKTSKLMADMSNWASPEAYRTYLQLRGALMVEKGKVPIDDLLSYLANLIVAIRSDLGYDDEHWSDKELNAIGFFFLKDTMLKAGKTIGGASEDRDS